MINTLTGVTLSLLGLEKFAILTIGLLNLGRDIRMGHSYFVMLPSDLLIF